MFRTVIAHKVSGASGINIRIEHKKLTSTSTSMNVEEDEDVFTLMFDGFRKAYPDNCDEAFPVSMPPRWHYTYTMAGLHSSIRLMYTPV